MWCLENFVKFINRNAYIMIAIYGRNFCMSARDALQLLLTNPLRALVLDRVTEFVLLLGRLMITCGVAVLAFFFFSKGFYVDPAWRKYFQPDLHYYWVPLATVIVITYFVIAKAFLTVFELAVDTIFLCKHSHRTSTFTNRSVKIIKTCVCLLLNRCNERLEFARRFGRQAVLHVS